MQDDREIPVPDWRSRIDKRFTALRGAAALMVMLAHYQYIGFLPGLPIFKYSGQCALMAFFFLSSFLLCHSLAADAHWPARPHLALIPYAINRLFRIAPLLAVVLALTFLEQAVIFPFAGFLFRGAEIVAQPRKSAVRSLDHTGRADVLSLSAVCARADRAGDALALRRRGGRGGRFSPGARRSPSRVVTA